jgi:signal transduction histidine kinase/FixJ family two-component response regulator
MAVADALPLNPTAESPGDDRTADALGFAHALLLDLGLALSNPTTFLAELARVFAVSSAGLAVFVDDRALKKHRYSRADSALPAGLWPWEENPQLLRQSWASLEAREIESRTGRQILLSGAEKPDGLRWLLWLEKSSKKAWHAREKASFELFVHLLERILGTPEEKAGWEKAIEQRRIRKSMEQTASVTGRVAHDFGNVLTALLGYAELALPQLVPGSLPHQHVSEMYQAAQLGAQMIRKLSLFSRRRPSGSRMASVHMALAGEMMRVQKSWQPDVDVKLDLPSHLPAVAIDSESLKVHVEQLLANAREAIRGKGTVQISAQPIELTENSCLDYLGSTVPGPALEVAIADSGKGISSDIQNRLFKELFVTTKPGRRGLGLAVVYSLLELHQGGLRIENAAGGGTIARFVLPQVEARVAPEVVNRPTAPARERILVVDDDPLVLEMIATVLSQQGYRVERAPGGVEALETYRASARESFHLVITDLMMPALNGLDLARKLREDDPGINLMFITGNIGARTLLDDRAFCQVLLLSKPFRADGLLKAVRAALDRSPRGAAASPVARETPRQSLIFCSR